MTVQRSVLRGLWRSCLFLGVTVLLVPPYLFGQAFRPALARAVARLWGRASCRIAGLVVRRYGRPAEDRPTLYVANHVSYLDIPIIAAAVDAIFVAKREVASWPLFGFIARIGRTIFIEREPTHADAECALLCRVLARGESLLLFPEGTSSEGSDVLPFKSSLFEAALRARAEPVPVQPVSLSYRGFRSGPVFEGEERLLYAWCGEMTLLPHLWKMLTLPGAEVVLHFHPPVAPPSLESRKALAEYARRQIAESVRTGTRGAAPLGPAVEDGEVEERPAVAGG